MRIYEAARVAQGEAGDNSSAGKGDVGDQEQKERLAHKSKKPDDGLFDKLYAQDNGLP